MQPTADHRPLLAGAERGHAEAIHQLVHPVVVGVDPLRAALAVLPTHERGAHGAHSTTRPVPSLEHRHVGAGGNQALRGAQAREPGTDNDNSHGRRWLRRRR